MNKIFSLGLFLVSAVAIGAGDWPQWRGPARDGSVHGKPWPSSIDETVLRPLWRVELGSSYSGPIVSGDLVVTTETVGKKSESVRAYDRVTGKQIWHSEWKGAMSVPFFAKEALDSLTKLFRCLIPPFPCWKSNLHLEQGVHFWQQGRTVPGKLKF